MNYVSMHIKSLFYICMFVVAYMLFNIIHWNFVVLRKINTYFFHMTFDLENDICSTFHGISNCFNFHLSKFYILLFFIVNG